MRMAAVYLSYVLAKKCVGRGEKFRTSDYAPTHILFTSLATVTMASKGLILVTGATSFVAAPIIELFLNAGYQVRGQVRNESSSQKVHKVFPTAGTALTTVIVPDITVPGAFNAAVKDVVGVIHTASPFTVDVENNERDLLDPAIKGTTRILEAVYEHAPQVKRVVVTSSFAAIMDPAKGAWSGGTYTEKDWNPTTYEVAVSTEHGVVAYCASKTFAEKAARDFVEAKKPNFTLSTINPPMIYGPPSHDVDIKHLNASMAEFYRLMDGSSKEPGLTAVPAFADVRDVAVAHFKAFELAEPGRFLVSSGSYEYRDVARVLREEFPDRADKIADPEATPHQDAYKVDNSATAKTLGMTFRTARECFRDTGLSLIALEQGKTWKEVSSAA